MRQTRAAWGAASSPPWFTRVFAPEWSGRGIGVAPLIMSNPKDFFVIFNHGPPHTRKHFQMNLKTNTTQDETTQYETR